ncbi:2-isopropylmalate synthase [Methylovulum psychrotolerans]|uniref:2-isopropylmalate synthase n=1 Tax=Methylovulum psychrotolerans TaxID=1704499 RepID=UPI001BFF9172|nr:2-isopropylmalate synthase [Methylovulum psychrotolerans]MBT9099779.1 2-isopropylmalate synthase [Methylovulum psychrotolerans]
MSKAQISAFNHHKYRPFPPVDLPQRQWPNRRIRQAPRWCSVDLRDGNQALINPLSIAQKLDFFRLLVAVGFKEIEIGFPSASQTDFDFARLLIEQNLIPDDVTVSILTPARPALIERSFAALQGVRRALVHLYNSTSKLQRERVFNLDKASITALAVTGAEAIRACALAQPETAWRFEYSPESFNATELDYALEICQAVCRVWQPSTKCPIIINLPATVEMATPNVYADQIEWFSRHIQPREAVILSIHPHNDRGCAVAAAELAMLAGAQRVEGTLLGNGERTGNLDIAVMAMNLYSQGIDPELDFSDMTNIARQVSQFNQIAVHPRHPYIGDLVFTAFSGSHQDAIKKCLAASQPEEAWQVAYLPIDPNDVGRNYQEVIRVNSQSGKAGSTYLIEQALGLHLPRWLQVDFSQIVQQESERQGCEISAQALVALFRRRYLEPAAYRLVSFEVASPYQVSAQLHSVAGEVHLTGQGNGVLAAFTNALSHHLGKAIEISDYHEHALAQGSDAQAACYIRLHCAGVTQIGMACHNDIVSASLAAVLNSFN